MADPEVARYLIWVPHTDIAFTGRLLAAWEAESGLDDVYHWAITLRADGEVVGDISVVSLDKRTESAQLGWCLSRRLWGRGLMTEAVGRVVDYLFSEVGLYRIAARHVVQNAASGRVMEKCGMRAEGVLRGDWRMLSTGEHADVCVHAILRGEWERRHTGAARWVNAFPERFPD